MKDASFGENIYDFFPPAKMPLVVRQSGQGVKHSIRKGMEERILFLLENGMPVRKKRTFCFFCV